MALIDSPRLLDGDRQHWQRMERYDALTSANINKRAAAGRQAIYEWASAGPGICGVSWGKDSVVTAHLVATSGVDIPIVRVRFDPFEMPDTDLVRDEFLRRYPHVRYEERTTELRSPRRGEPGFDQHIEDPTGRQDVLKETIRERYISGVRADESRTRRLSINALGTVTRRTCRPLAGWTAIDVFAYLYRERLPVHPAYAMTYSGALDRRWVRVHALASLIPGRRSHEVAAWEDAYYGDVIAAGIASRAHMWTEPRTR